MSHLSLPFAAAGLLLLTAATHAQDTLYHSPPVPAAPAQSEPWTPPPSTLPPAVVGAAAELFREGLADPRGCEYRKIEIPWVYVTIQTEGWVLPANGPIRFAVGWDGLVHPLKSVGPPVDLVHEFTTQNRKTGFQGLHDNWPVSDNWSLGLESMLALKAAYLLRLGHADLAQDLWRRGFANDPQLAATDPQVLMARPWLDALYDRALRAHLDGDDALSLQTCRLLVPLQAQVEAGAAKRGLSKPPNSPLYFETLAGLPALAADQERRAKEAPYVPVMISGQPASGPERITALVRDLEQVAARQMMNPGQTDVSMDTVVTMLIREGGPAVGPLLDCLEHDTRLTRSEFTQGMQASPGSLIPVYQAAYMALTGIMERPFFFNDQDDRSIFNPTPPADPRDAGQAKWTLADRREMAAKIRAYWESNAGRTLPERWYATLLDDHAAASSWFDAVDRIVQSTHVTAMPRSMYGGGWGSGGPQPGDPMRGESLRTKTNPPVSELIRRRFDQLGARAATDKSIDFEPMGKLILALADWDGKAHLDDIRDMAAVFHARFPNAQGPFNSTLTTDAKIFRRRLELGDTRALPEYAAWITQVDTARWSYFFLGDPFQIMWHYPTDPNIRRSAEKIFSGPGSPWVPFTRIEALSDLLTKPLVGLAAFRQQAVEGLGDRSVAGTLTTYDNGNAGYLLTGQTQPITVTIDHADPLLPKSPGTTSFRLCDLYAYQLSQIDAFPVMQLYWPQSRRDEAIGAIRAFLLRYGDDFQDRPDDPYDDTIYAQNRDQTHLRISELTHPATTDDVQKGRAIFSLSGQTRIWKMPTFPLGACMWDRQIPAANALPGNPGPLVPGAAQGRIWQAEEVFENGKWQRYFGFEGSHEFRKVAASEIDFPAPEWTRIHTWMDGLLEGPPTPPRNFFRRVASAIAPGTPLFITVKIHNHTGLDERVDPRFLLPAIASAALPPGIHFQVLYTPRIAPEALKPPGQEEFVPFFGPWVSHPPFDYGAWTELPLRPEVVMNAGASSAPILPAANELDLLKLDLRFFFDVGRPGTYKVKALFDPGGAPPVGTNEVTFTLAKAGT